MRRSRKRKTFTLAELADMSPEQLEELKTKGQTVRRGVIENSFIPTPDLLEKSFVERRVVLRQIDDYFPGNEEVPKEGDWILVTADTHCEYTPPILSVWFAVPWAMTGMAGAKLHRVKVVTPRGDMGLFPREYARVNTLDTYLSAVGCGYDMKFFGTKTGVDPMQLFYIRSRGVSKVDAIKMLFTSCREPGVAWFEASEEIQRQFGFEPVIKRRDATVTDPEFLKKPDSEVMVDVRDPGWEEMVRNTPTQAAMEYNRRRNRVENPNPA